MKKIELLAPAGNMECLKAAVICGADAVYIGGQKFGARSFAGNFSNSEIIEAIKYCHLYNVKLYVTVNTIIFESEINEFISFIKFLYINNVDAIIIQDIGMMDLVRQKFPNLEIHASTQMHIHNEEGIKFLKKLGVKRAVIAREVSLDKIKEYNKVGLDLEVFVHGALCISYSGQCLMSYIIGKRSGNRGECAGSCRLPYKNENDSYKYILSTKDLCFYNNIEKLIESNISSIKIEGRMKKKEYVASVVSIYRKKIDNYYKGIKECNNEDINELKVMFNRNFTLGHLGGEKDIINDFRPNHLGIEVGKVICLRNDKISIKVFSDINKGDGIRFIGKNDCGLKISKMFINGKIVDSAKKGDILDIYFNKEISINSKVVKTSDYKLLEKYDFLIKEDLKIDINGFILAKNGQNLYAEITDGINKVSSSSSFVVQKAINNPTSSIRILSQFSKFGSSCFNIVNLKNNIEDNIFVSIIEINNLRRNLVAKLMDLRINKNNKNIIFGEYKNDFISNFKSECFIINCFLNSNKNYKKLKNEYNGFYCKDYNFCLENDSCNLFYKVGNIIDSHKDLTYKNLLIGELGSLNKYTGNLVCDYTFNVVNSFSLYLLFKMGAKRVVLSYESDFLNTKKLILNFKKRYLFNPNVEIILHSRIPAMNIKGNILENSRYIIDRFNKKYPVEYKNGITVVYDAKITSHVNDIEKYKLIGVNNIRIEKCDN